MGLLAVTRLMRLLNAVAVDFSCFDQRGSYARHLASRSALHVSCRFLSRRKDERIVCKAPVKRDPQASYLAWLDCRQLGLGDDPAEQLNSRARIALSPGPRYGPPGAWHARLNFGTSPQLVDEMIDRIASVVRAG